ncbi:MAG: hypothetical protein J7530_20370 [Novosphingobium sp.]|nr:hypothetical protein [Novosphingobium sp.]
MREILDSRFPKAIVWGSSFTTIYNGAFVPILGDKHVALGRSFADIWSESWDEIGPIAERAYAGEPTYIEEFPLVINRTGQDERTWFTFCYSPLRLANGSIMGLIFSSSRTGLRPRSATSSAILLSRTIRVVRSCAKATISPSAHALLWLCRSCCMSLPPMPPNMVHCPLLTDASDCLGRSMAIT